MRSDVSLSESGVCLCVRSSRPSLTVLSRTTSSPSTTSRRREWRPLGWLAMAEGSALSVAACPHRTEQNRIASQNSFPETGRRKRAPLMERRLERQGSEGCAALPRSRCGIERRRVSLTLPDPRSKSTWAMDGRFLGWPWTPSEEYNTSTAHTSPSLASALLSLRSSPLSSPSPLLSCTRCRRRRRSLSTSATAALLQTALSSTLSSA